MSPDGGQAKGGVQADEPEGDERRARVAVLLRTRVDNPKVRHSMAQLAGGTAFDFYVLAHEEPGCELDFGPVAKLSYSLDSFRDLGFEEVENPYFLTHCADVLFGLAQARLPQYDWYVLVDIGVFIRPTEPLYFEQLAAQLAERPEGSLDMVAVKLGFSDPEWPWHPAAARLYERVLTIAFPVLALSRRVIPYLLEERLKDAERVRATGAELNATGDPDGWIFCEAFVGSALWAGARFHLTDLNHVLPGSYALESFTPGPPGFLTQQTDHGPPLSHLVMDERDFLEQRLSESWRDGTVEAFKAELKTPPWPIPAPLIWEFQQRVGATPDPSENAHLARRVAILLRTHVDNAQVRHSMARLAGGSGYDFYVLAHEEPGRELDFGPAPKLSHSMQSLRDLGFEVDSPYFLMHCADVLFGFIQDRLPGYDWYVLVENDVFIRPSRPGYFERLAAALAAPPEGVLDMAVVKLGFSDPIWMWHPAVHRVYDRVLSTFFPVVALSKRAIPYLLAERLKEQQRVQAAGIKCDGTADPDNLMFCEAFIASALWAARYPITDLNLLMPGSYVEERFNTGPPQLLSDQPLDGPPDLAHPVLDDRDFLEKHLFFSWRTDDLPAFIEALRRPAWPMIPDALLREYEARAIEQQAAPNTARQAESQAPSPT